MRISRFTKYMVIWGLTLGYCGTAAPTAEKPTETRDGK
jgi:hypothetical protein